jgi:hypothetical protein
MKKLNKRRMEIINWLKGYNRPIYVVGCDYPLALKMANEGIICKVPVTETAVVNDIYDKLGLRVNKNYGICPCWPQYKFHLKDFKWPSN